jgi:hypothetical protein
MTEAAAFDRALIDIAGHPTPGLYNVSFAHRTPCDTEPVHLFRAGQKGQLSSVAEGIDSEPPAGCLWRHKHHCVQRAAGEDQPGVDIESAKVICAEARPTSPALGFRRRRTEITRARGQGERLESKEDGAGNGVHLRNTAKGFLQATAEAGIWQTHFSCSCSLASRVALLTRPRQLGHTISLSRSPNRAFKRRGGVDWRAVARLCRPGQNGARRPAFLYSRRRHRKGPKGMFEGEHSVASPWRPIVESWLGQEAIMSPCGSARLLSDGNDFWRPIAPNDRGI